MSEGEYLGRLSGSPGRTPHTEETLAQILWSMSFPSQVTMFLVSLHCIYIFKKKNKKAKRMKNLFYIDLHYLSGKASI